MKKIRQVKKGEAPSLLDTDKANEVINALNVLNSIEVSPAGVGRFVYSENKIIFEINLGNIRKAINELEEGGPGSTPPPAPGYTWSPGSWQPQAGGGESNVGGAPSTGDVIEVPTYQNDDGDEVLGDGSEPEGAPENGILTGRRLDFKVGGYQSGGTFPGGRQSARTYRYTQDGPNESLARLGSGGSPSQKGGMILWKDGGGFSAWITPISGVYTYTLPNGQRVDVNALGSVPVELKYIDFYLSPWDRWVVIPTLNGELPNYI